uniref:alpha/beta fold hydrolase n=1 Tax=Paractinoplanes polyasparticus TaxID=2856853 RepID=UPI001C861D26|nr:alpha/beta hydrolase [Actinoplanes polyasparticus]
MAPDLYVREYGPPDAPAVLFLHGGPGQGSYEFEQHQAPVLATRLRVVCLDQRGVLRSAALPEDATVRLDDLVADCETVREDLGLPDWAVLGQSFGGMLALRYAVAHPGSVRAVAFENPAWDLGRTCRSLLAAFLAHPSAGSHPEAVAAGEALLASAPDDKTLWNSLIDVLAGFGADRAAIYTPDLAARGRIWEVLQAAPFEAAQWQRGADHATRLAEDPAFFEPHTPLLAGLRQPALLIKGGLDPIPSPGEVADFRRARPDAVVRVFPDCGHFVHAEAPAEYAAAVFRLTGV